MATTNDKPIRKVSLRISVLVPSVTPEQAQEIEDKIRDIADDYGVPDVQATRGAERPQ